MKTAIYIEDGVTQLVLTPETEYEKGVINSFGDRLDTVQIFNGTFYDCRGGWVRQSAHMDRGIYDPPHRARDSSLIMKLSQEGK